MRRSRQRPRRRPLLRDRRAGRPACARGDRPRAAGGHVAVRGRAGALDLGDGRAVGDRARARAARLGAPADRAVPGAADPRRPHHGRRQQRAPVGAPVRCDRARGPARRRALRRQRRADGATAASSRRSWRPPSRSATPANGSRRCSRPACRAGRSTTTPTSSPTGTRSRARWWSSSSTRSRARCARSGCPLKLSDTPGEIRRPAPLLGEHTEEVLREAGLAADEIAEVVG